MLRPAWAMTINKSQGLTLKEGIVVDLEGSARYKPAGKHGLVFVAFTRSESFARTAFHNLPSFDDFKKGQKSDLLLMRKAFVEGLMSLHRTTLARWSDMPTQEAEDIAAEKWRCERRQAMEEVAARAKGATCAACDAAWG